METHSVSRRAVAPLSAIRSPLATAAACRRQLRPVPTKLPSRRGAALLALPLLLIISTVSAASQAATSLQVEAPNSVQPGATFEIRITALNADGSVDTSFTHETLSQSLLLSTQVQAWHLQISQVTQSSGTVTYSAQLAGSGTDGSPFASQARTYTATLTTDFVILVNVVASALAVTAPAMVMVDTDFDLRVAGVDAEGREDLDYTPSLGVVVSASAGMLAQVSNTTAGLTVSLSGVANGTTVTLTVTDGALSGATVVTAVAEPALDVDGNGAVDAVDAVLTLRVLLLPTSIRDLLLDGNASVAGLVVAGFPSLASDEMDIVNQAVALNMPGATVMDIDRSGAVDSVDAVLLLRVLLLPTSIRDLLLDGHASVAGLVVAGFPSLTSDEAAIVTRVVDIAADN